MRALVLVLASVPSLALAQHWTVNGVNGTYGSAERACQAALDGHPTLEFAPPARRRADADDPDREFRECWVRTKGASSADGGNEPIFHTLAWFTPRKDDEEPEAKDDAKPDAGTKVGCGSDTDFSWFPSFKTSPLKAAGATVVPDTKAGSCSVKSRTAGERMFLVSKKAVRADLMKKESKPVGEHYFLKRNGLIIDPTVMQFFRVHSEPGARFDGLTFVGTEAQLVQAADTLFQLCGSNPATNDAKTGAEFKAIYFDDAKLCNPGSGLKLVQNVGSYAKNSCEP
jgi:hypothetical protein